ncbi:MAG TPA: translation initiation factor IF-2 [Bacteroidales bacterium]|nr:translation initiation factor IF-2 [Bacteroidales bacterium]
MKESGTIRLNKAAREFNVGQGTIVEFLLKKGFQIDQNPNTRLTGEMYELLSREYIGEKSVKEEAMKKDISSVKREVLTIDDRKTISSESRYEDDDEDLIIRGVKIEIDEEFKKAIESPAIRKTETKDLDELVEDLLIEKPVENDVLPDRVIDIDSEQEEPEKEIIAAPDKIKPKRTKKTTPKAETEKAEHKEEVIEDQKPVEEQQPAEAKKIQDTKIIAEEEKKTEAKKESDDKEKDIGLKIIGKIDLDSINERTKPPKKTIEEKRKERESKKKTEVKKPKTTIKKEKIETTVKEKPKKVVKGKDDTVVKKEAKQKDVQIETPPPLPPTKPIEKEVEFIKLKVERLTGPNILGKIELPETKRPEKQKPIASSSDEKVKTKRKKRKRIKPEEAKAEPVKPKPAEKQPEEKAKTKAKIRLQRHKRLKKDDRPVLTDEDIQKQIKETMARLTSGGKSKASKHRRQKRDLISKIKEKELQEIEEEKSIIKVAEFVTANEMASMMNVPVTQIISLCMQLGLVVSINQRLDAETIIIVAEEFGYKVEFTSVESAIDEADFEEDRPEDLTQRSPIVTVMGHVDHGKTKLLDYIRRTNVIAGEAGGITQHIGAYEVNLENGKRITFLDTPGHEAFTAMRARGAKVTDIAIIVIAADDNVMPQTKEAINHALAAQVPIVFAINKIDKPTAKPEKIKEQLSALNILVEDWGGKYQSQEISAVTGQNVDVLLEKVLLEAELLDLKANPNRRALGTVIESSLDKGRGFVAKLLVQNGTLKVGDIVLAGLHSGKVKAMYNARNKRVNQAGPSSPLLVLGINGAPQAGDIFRVMTDEREARNIAAKRTQLQREQGLRTQKHITLDEIGRRIAIGDFKELNLIVKGDVDGTVEALSDSLLKLSKPEVQVNVIHKSVGQVTETDVMLASASNAIIIAFQVRPSVGARKLAEHEQIDIRLYSIIYTAIEEIKSAIEGMLSPEIEEKITCNVEVREVFKIAKVGTIAGCMVLDGTITRNTMVRLIRDGIVVYTGKLASLKRFKDDVKEVNSGYECGLSVENFNDIKIGDIIEGYEMIEIARKFD